MQLLSNAGSLSIRRKTNVRSLFLEYPRGDGGDAVLADLFNLNQTDIKINLPIVNANMHGIEFELPVWLTGVFYLKVQDGNKSFLKKIAIQ